MSWFAKGGPINIDYTIEFGGISGGHRTGSTKDRPGTLADDATRAGARSANALRALADAPARPRVVGEFSGLEYDFAVGEVYGLRAWKVDQYGRLRALHISTAPPWRPGVNVAVCKRLEGSPTFYDSPKVCLTVPAEDCRCGFYAYTDAGHEEVDDSDDRAVLGIVRGTGRTLLGTRGFRCEKAEIVALVDPSSREGEKRERLAARVTAVYPDVHIVPDWDALLNFAPITSTMPEIGSAEFWALP